MTLTFLLVLLPSIIVPFIARIVWPHHINWRELGVSLVAGIAITSFTYFVGLHNETKDYEIWNGQVTEKVRKHDTYQRSYQCNPRTDSKGNVTYSTCYETRYTVEWFLRTTAGDDVGIDKEDSGSRRVYSKPDPADYVAINVGDPVAIKNKYVNYIKAVPDSLFHAYDTKKYESLVPPYPLDVYSHIKLNRALSMGVSVPDVGQWSQDISMILRRLGPEQQANLITLFVNTADQDYANALRGKWLGGKKNDVIVVFGTTQYPKIDFVEVVSWTKNELFKVQLRDELFAMENINRAEMIPVIESKIRSMFVRMKMADYEYLKAKIEPPTWVLTLAVILGTIISIVASIYFYKNDPFRTTRSGFGRPSANRVKGRRF